MKQDTAALEASEATQVSPSDELQKKRRRLLLYEEGKRRRLLLYEEGERYNTDLVTRYQEKLA